MSRPFLALCALLAALAAAGLWFARSSPRPAPQAVAEPPASQEPAVRFVPLGPGAGVTGVTVCGEGARLSVLEFNGTGVGLIDYDGDGWLDIYVVHGGRLSLETHVEDGQEVRRLAGWTGYGDYLYRNRDDGTFEDKSGLVRIAGAAWGQGVAVGDADGDGDPDIYVTNLGPNRLLLNRGDGGFEEAAERLGVADPRWGASAVFLDLENDGDLDLAVANYLKADPAQLDAFYRKPCDFKGIKTGCGPGGFASEPCALYRQDLGVFQDAGPAMGFLAPKEGYCLGVLPVDVNVDGSMDLYVACDAGPNLLYVNESGTLVEQAGRWGVAVAGDGRPQASMGVDAADLNADGTPEIFVTNFSGQTNTLYLSGPFPAPYLDHTYAANLAPEESFLGLAWGTRFLDYDHDGLQDLLVAQGHLYGNIDELHDPAWSYEQHNLLFRGFPDVRFEEVGGQAGLRELPRASSRGLAVGDLDNDGDLDWVETVIDGPPRVWINRGGNRRAWVSVRLRGRGANTEGIGARVAITSGQGRGPEGGEPARQVRWVTRAGSYQSSSDVRAHFGLGATETVDRLEVLWPSGAVQVLEKLPARRHYVITEGEPTPAWTEPGSGW